MRKLDIPEPTAIKGSIVPYVRVGADLRPVLRGRNKSQ